MNDRFTRLLLALIASALWVIALRGPVVPQAHADTPMTCHFDGPLSIRGIDGRIKVEVEPTFGTAGSSSGRPYYVQVVQ